MKVYGVGAEAVLDAIQERRRSDARGDDGRRLALVVQGGAMRGVYSIGALVALEQLGLTDVFDEVHASSSGALNAAYFLAGQAAYGQIVYYRYANTRTFINPLRLRKIVDLDYLFDRVLGELRPLDVDRVLASRSRFLVTLMERRSGRQFQVDVGDVSAPLMQVLKASCAMPLLYNRPVRIDGRDCLDGSFPNGIPIREALADGATHILVCLTRPASFRERRRQAVERWVFELLCARGNRRLRTRFARAHQHNNAVHDLALGCAGAPPGVHIATLCPGDADVRLTTIRTARIKAGVRRMTRRTLAAFGDR